MSESCRRTVDRVCARSMRCLHVRVKLRLCTAPELHQLDWGQWAAGSNPAVLPLSLGIYGVSNFRWFVCRNPVGMFTQSVIVGHVVADFSERERWSSFLAVIFFRASRVECRNVERLPSSCAFSRIQFASGAEIVRRWDGNPIGGRLVVELARKPCVFGPARVAGSLS